MWLPLTLSLASAIAPLGVDVSTADGHRRFVPVADADATPFEVCAGEVCAPVTTHDGRLVATLDLPTTTTGDDAVFVVHSERMEFRSASPAAIAVGFGLAAVGLGLSAAGVGIVSTSLSTPVGVAQAAPSATASETGVIAGQVSVAMWLGAGAAALGAVVAGVVAVSE